MAQVWVLALPSWAARVWRRQFCQRLFGRHRKWERAEIIVPPGANVLAAQMLDERIVTPVLGHDVKMAGWITRHGPPDVVGKGEIQRVLAGSSQPHQLHRGGVRQKPFDERNVKPRLLRPQQQGETDGPAADDPQINLMHVLEIHEHVVHRRREIIGWGRHAHCLATGPRGVNAHARGLSSTLTRTAVVFTDANGGNEATGI